MAGKTNLVATLFAQKKLLGKTSTGVHRADNQEPIPSGLQVAAQSIFSQDVPGSPAQTLWTVQSASLGKPATVEYVEFTLTQITGSTYDANDYDSDAPSQASGPHAYRLALTGNYESLTDNTKAGNGTFDNDEILHWSLGSLQMVSPGFSNDAPNPYTVKIYSGTRDVDDEIPLLDELDWQVDYYSGVLFIQDYNSGKIPTRARGFIYVGDMLSASLGSSGGSGTGVGWFGSGNGSISTTGSLLVGTNTAVPGSAEISFTSIGAAVFNEQARNSDFRVETQNRTHAIFADASTNQVLLLSGGAAGSSNESTYTDVAFFVSGTKSARGTTTKGVSLFGGDVHISGSLTVDGSSPGGGGSGTGVGWIGASAGIISTTGSVYVGVSGGTSAPDITFSDGGAAVFNEQAGNADFRVESQTNTHMLFVDASTSTVGIGTSTPKKTLSVVGAISASLGLSGSLTRLVDGSSYLVAGSNVTIASSSNGSITISSAGGGGGGSGTGVGWFGPSAGQINTTGSLGVSGSLSVAQSINHIGETGSKIDFVSGKVLILSGGAATSVNPSSFTDTSFFVSGTWRADGSEDGIKPTSGISAFGGDVVTSGNLWVGTGNSSYSVFHGGTTHRTGMKLDYSSGNGQITFWTYGSERFSISQNGTAEFTGANLLAACNATIDLDAGSTVKIDAPTVTIGGDSDTDTIKLVSQNTLELTGSQILILSGGAPGSLDPKNFADTAFFVSGTIDSRGTTTPGAAVFGGDVVVSGTLSINRNQAGVGSFVTVTSDGKVGIGSDTPAYKLSVGGNMDVGEYIYHKNDANTYLRFQEDQLHIKAGGESMIKMKEDSSNQVLILSGGSGNSIDPDGFADTNFFVSGTIGSRGTSTAGTSVFGGDVVISGSANVGSMTTSGHILPASDTTYNLGSDSHRFANIYTGDLHLKNERGNWTIIEEADYLCVVNNVTGKKFKMVLEPL